MKSSICTKNNIDYEKKIEANEDTEIKTKRDREEENSCSLTSPQQTNNVHEQDFETRLQS